MSMMVHGLSISWTMEHGLTLNHLEVTPLQFLTMQQFLTEQMALGLECLVMAITVAGQQHYSILIISLDYQMQHTCSSDSKSGPIAVAHLGRVGSWMIFLLQMSVIQ